MFKGSIKCSEELSVLKPGPLCSMSTIVVFLNHLQFNKQNKKSHFSPNEVWASVLEEPARLAE